MSVIIECQIKESARCLRDIVWPKIKGICGGGQLIPVEEVTDSPFAKQLDTLAGIDAWQISNDRLLRGIASRIQYEPDIYESFTIRTSLPSGRDTELQKRLRAIKELERGWLFPALTIQAYLTKDHAEFIQAAIVRTRDLILQAKEKCDQGIDVKPAPGGNRFVIVWWKELLQAGIKVSIVTSTGSDYNA